MIAKKYRFQGQNGIKYVFRRGKTIRTRYCSVRYVDNPKRNTYRLSVVVSKKVDKRAPVRNRIRRRLYEQLRLQAPSVLKREDVVITVHDASLAYIESEKIDDLVNKILTEISASKRKHVE